MLSEEHKIRKRFSHGKENKLFLCAKNEIPKILILRIFFGATYLIVTETD